MNAILRFRHPPKIRSPATPGLCWLFFQWPGLGFLGFAPPRPAQLHLTPSLAAAINFAHTAPPPMTGNQRMRVAGNFCEATLLRCSWSANYHSPRARQGSAFSAMSVAAFGQ